MKADWSLADRLITAHPLEAAAILERATPEASAAVLNRGSTAIIAATLQRMAPEEAAAVLTRLPVERTVTVLAELSLGAAGSLLRSLAPPDRDRLLEAAPDETTRSLRAALSHPEGSAGSMMDSNVLAFPMETSVGEARRRARRRSKRAGNYMYVVDGQRKLAGAVSLSELMHASPSTGLASLMRPSVFRLSALAGVDSILGHAGWRELHAIPVVDAEGVLVGVVRRETYEKLRSERAEAGGEGTGGLGLALAELAWTAMISTVDEVARALKTDDVERREERGHAN